MKTFFYSINSKYKLVLSHLLMLMIFIFSCSVSYAETTYEKVLKTKVMLAGNSGSYPPFEMMEGSKLIGFDADLADELGRRMGVKISFEVIDFKGMIASLTSKRVDVLISALTWTQERAEKIAYSIPYYDAGIGSLYNIKDPILTLADLKGKIVGVQLGSSGDLFIREKAASIVKEVKTYDDILFAVKDLENGRVNVVVNPVPVLKYNSKNLPTLKVSSVWENRVVGINTRKEDLDLLNAINKNLEAMKADGFLKKLEKKWFES